MATYTDGNAQHATGTSMPNTNTGVNGTHNNGTLGGDNRSSITGGRPSYANEKGGAPLRSALTPGGHVADSSQPAFPVYHRRLANPAPLGLMGFATTTLLLSLINVGTRGVTTPNIVVGLALGYGGLAQLLAGMWEGACGNTFGFTAFSSYGAFWFSYAAILIPWTGIGAAYTGEAAGQETNAIGLYLMCWMIVTFIFLLGSLRSSIGLVSVFFFLTFTFMLLGIGELIGSSSVATAGGAFGIITAFIAYYVAAAGLFTPDDTFFVLPVGPLSRKD